MNRELGEYEYLLSVLGSEAEVWKVLQYQFSVIHQRTQTVFTLGGLGITVTGFSGHRIIAAGLYSGVPLVIGLVIILIALFVGLYGVSRLRWISEFRCADRAESFRRVIAARNQKSLFFRVSLTILLVGLCFYVLAISNFLLLASRGVIAIY